VIWAIYPRKSRFWIHRLPRKGGNYAGNHTHWIELTGI